MKTISVSLRTLLAFMLVCVLLVAGVLFLRPVPLAQASSVDAIEMFWWGGRIGQPWGNQFNDDGGWITPQIFEKAGAMLQDPVLTSWEDVEVFTGWRQVFFRTPYGELFELRSPAHSISNPQPGTIARVDLTADMIAAGATTWSDVRIMAGDRHVLALTPYGELFAWGNNQFGQLGIASSFGGEEDVPQLVPLTPAMMAAGAQSWNDVEFIISSNHTLARVGNELFGWGQNNSGQLAQGATSPSIASPVPIDPLPGQTNWSNVELFGGSNYNLALVGDYLFGWGINGQGQIGQDVGAATSFATPVQIQPSDDMIDRGINSWAGIEIMTHIGGSRTFAKHTATGYMFSWGQSNAGQTGTGYTTDRLVPTFVSLSPDMIAAGVTSWNGVEVIMGAGHAFARTPAGKMFVWGNNASGQLGNGTSIGGNEPAPVLIPITPIMEAAGMETWNDVVLVPGFVTNFALMRVPGIPLEKTVKAPEGTTIPNNLSFSFGFIPRQVRLSDEPIRYSKDEAYVPNIPNQTLTLDMATLTTAGGTTTVAGSMNLRPLVTGADFFQGETGIFVWEVYEIPNSSSINASPEASTMIYDTARFQFRAHVDRDGTIILTVYEMEQNVQGEWVLTDRKPNALSFTNIFRSRIAADSALEIKKEVEGDMANLTTPFNFTLNLTAHELAPFPTPLSIPAQRIAADNSVTNVTITSLPHNFTLLHGETFRIPELYGGTTWNVEELAHLEFRAGISVIVGGTEVHTHTNPLPNQLLSSGDRLVHDTGRNAAYFTNIHHWDVPTGLVINNLPFIIPLAAAVMLGLMLASRKRRIIEEMPLVN